MATGIHLGCPGDDLEERLARYTAKLQTQKEMCLTWAANTSVHYPQGVYCETAWDGYSCWGPTPTNTTVSQPCPEFIGIGNDTFSYRTCTSSGVWAKSGWTNYNLCYLHYAMQIEKNCPPVMPNSEGMITTAEAPIHSIDTDLTDHTTYQAEKLTATILMYIYFFGSILTLLLLGTTLFIFTYFKTLQCSRISIHKNLVASFILRSIVLIINSEPYVVGRTQSFRDIDWLCKVLTCVLIYSYIANIFWMFVEGLFLHNRIAVTVFHTEAPFKVFYSLGWVLPGFIVCVWSVCLHFFNPSFCWGGYGKQAYFWIVLVPCIAALLVNTVFLVNIIRILITRLRANNTLETDQVRKAVKATAVLFPLLGMTNMLFFVPPGGGPTSEIVYRIINAILQSSQGIIVSVIYCFMNAEVRLAIRKKWLRYQNVRRGRSYTRRQSYRTSSMFVSTSEGPNLLQNRKENPSITSQSTCHLVNSMTTRSNHSATGSKRSSKGSTRLSVTSTTPNNVKNKTDMSTSSL